MLILVDYRELMGTHSVFSLLSPSSLSGFLFRRTSRSSHRRLIFASFSSIDLTWPILLRRLRMSTMIIVVLFGQGKQDRKREYRSEG